MAADQGARADTNRSQACEDAVTTVHDRQVEGRWCPKDEVFTTTEHGGVEGPCSVPWSDHPLAVQRITIRVAGRHIGRQLQTGGDQ